MTKRLLAALLCAILVMALLPATALAEKYNGWDSTKTYTDDDIITIGDKDYTYKGVVSTATGLDLKESSGNLVYKSGNGYILCSHNGTTTTLTLNNATTGDITLKGSCTLVLNGTNSTGDILVQTVGSAISTNPLDITVAEGASLIATHTISAGSVTVTGDTSALNTIAITNNGFIFYGPNTITGAGATAQSFTVDAGATVTVNDENVKFGSATSTPSTLTNNGKIIINNGKALNLSSCTTITNAGTIVNNGILVLAATSTDIAAIKALGLTGSGMVKVGDNYYTNKGETIHKYVSLNFSTREYRKYNEFGDIYTHILDGHDLNDYGFKIKGDKESGYIITLGNLLIEPNKGESETSAITLPQKGNVTVRLKDGATTRITNPNGSGIFIASSDDVCTIDGTGKLEIQVSTGKGAISVPRLIIEGGDITINNNSENGYGIDAHSSYADSTNRTVNITGGRLKITAEKAAIAARDGIIIGSGMHITSPSGATPGSYVDFSVPDSPIEYRTILIKKLVDGEPDDKVVTSVIIEPAPSSGGGGDDTPSSVTVYNDPSQPKATVWLSGNGLSSSDLLITERDPQGSAYKALLKLADSDDVFNTYNIYLRSGKKSTGSAMNLTFDLNAQYAGNDFTLVHQKADSTFEYFYDTADANGDLTFGPLYELSPFMLVKGRLAQTAFTSLTDAPKTGDSAQTVLYTGAALIMAAALAGLALRKQKRN